MGNVTGPGDATVWSSLELRWSLGLLQSEVEVGTPRRDGETVRGGEGSGCQRGIRGKEEPGMPWCPMRATGCDGCHVRAPFMTQSLGSRRGERELGKRR